LSLYVKAEKGEKEGNVEKLDMSKAYSKVKWVFLESIKTEMGFPCEWIDLVLTCISMVSFFFFTNGRVVSSIFLTWALR